MSARGKVGEDPTVQDRFWALGSIESIAGHAKSIASRPKVLVPPSELPMPYQRSTLVIVGMVDTTER